VVALLLKKLIFTLILVFYFPISVYAAEIPALSARSAVLINAETREVIYEKNSRERLSMASTTKIMTSLLALESGRLSDIVTAEDIQSEGTSIGLKNGYKLYLEDLVWGMMLESGNDAAKLTADYLAGSEENFAVLMNDKASSIGMADSHFVTASGLDSDGHYSTAYDMALLGAYAVSNPQFREICSSKTKQVEFIEPAVVRYFTNHNRLISMCDGVFGIKTGFTKKSGRCLVSACQRGGVVLIAVTLNAGDDWNDHNKLYNYGYKACEEKEVYVRIPENVKVYGGEQNFASLSLPDNPVKISLFDSNAKLTQRIILPEFVYAPIKCGDVAGKAQLIKDGKVIYEQDILYTQSVNSISALPETENIFEMLLSKIREIFK
jgi:D-alanyl-D-alanine carboxypeptidase/D-alanyl-D-alanine carboxypeptidase (penicillin-binding protein 5/6)